MHGVHVLFQANQQEKEEKDDETVFSVENMPKESGKKKKKKKPREGFSAFVGLREGEGMPKGGCAWLEIVEVTDQVTTPRSYLSAAFLPGLTQPGSGLKERSRFVPRGEWESHCRCETNEEFGF